MKFINVVVLFTLLLIVPSIAFAGGGGGGGGGGGSSVPYITPYLHLVIIAIVLFLVARRK